MGLYRRGSRVSVVVMMLTCSDEGKAHTDTLQPTRDCVRGRHMSC